MSANDGGSAFPAQALESEYRDGRYHDVWRPVGGMSLRDYFAGQALMNIAPHPRSGKTDEALAALYATRCYLMADAMLKAREAK